MFFGRDESDFLLGERNGDLAKVFASRRQVAIIVPTPVSEPVVMRIERDTRGITIIVRSFAGTYGKSRNTLSL